jgi:hypothetical protein
MFRCPRTGKKIDPGVEIDRSSLSVVHASPIAVNCPHCGARHDFPVAQGIWGRAPARADRGVACAEAAAGGGLRHVRQTL